MEMITKTMAKGKLTENVGREKGEISQIKLSAKFPFFSGVKKKKAKPKRNKSLLKKMK